jgi:hypothetical protein
MALLPMRIGYTVRRININYLAKIKVSVIFVLMTHSEFLSNFEDIK